ncbi:MAG: SGNH/GDSL hydrolase family protein [Flavobacteriaceae bacterium]|nr:SGNH/GDSL hydrolase family protein [Bacteroidia bacterium]NNL16397.1 SGNH/GDSL hydrolase family protein [Flavobacteriaceae bacterium]
MKKSFFTLFWFLISISTFVFYSCSEENLNDESVQFNIPVPLDDDPYEIKILSLGDGYTKGHNVCENCNYPAQLTDSISRYFNNDFSFKLNTLAEIGWTTSILIDNIQIENPDSNYDLVTLQIGVHNQFNNESFWLYFDEFSELADKAVELAKGDAANVIVLSIPDYSFTPFGQQSPDTNLVSEEIDNYNSYAKNYCDSKGISFVNITDITRMGLIDQSLVTFDEVNLSEIAFTKFVERILPLALDKLQ